MAQRGSDRWPEGSRVWIKMPGYCHWPAIVFPLRYCRKAEVPALLASYQPSRCLVHFYGSHNYWWAAESSLTPWTAHREARLAALRALARKSGVAAATLDELQGALGAAAASDTARELARMMTLWRGQPGAGAGGGGGGRKPQCSSCGEIGTQVTCRSCRSSFHTLCLPAPDISPEHMLAAAAAAVAAAAGAELGPEGVAAVQALWVCGACGRQNEVKGPPPHPARSKPVAPLPATAAGTAVAADQLQQVATCAAAAAHPPPCGGTGGSSGGHQRPVAGLQQLQQQGHPAWLELYERLMAEGVAEGAEAGPSVRPPPGTRLWVKTPGYCPWPAIVFSLRYCRKTEVPDLLASYQPGSTLVHFYGEHNHVWLPDDDVAALAAAAADPGEAAERLAGLTAWSRRKKGCSSGLLALTELEGAAPGPPPGQAIQPAAEVARLVGLREEQLAADEERRDREQLEQLLGAGSQGATTTPGLPGGSREGLGSSWRSRLRICAVCEEAGGQVSCRRCRRAFHALCLTPPCLSPAHMPPRHHWVCGSCGHPNEEVRGMRRRGRWEGWSGVCRMGLTPDWIIHAGAFRLFELPRPTASMPYIRGLLDPCTNSKSNPNIPAEKLYDKQDDGLRLSNSWSGYHVILNPEYTSQTQWRFVNRAIDEVESGSVPAVLLLCRNSTDTAYFQRLRPYPRVMLRRTSARFKDYDKTPIGFGVAVFCIARRGPARSPLYRRFIDAFGDWGEPNIPIDSAFVCSPEFCALLDRLSDHTTRHLRDNWAQCSACRKWRIVPYELFRLIDDDQQQPGEDVAMEAQEAQQQGLGLGLEREGQQQLQEPMLRTQWTCAQLG
uniref:PWWP domain-containing protein n=1 Tax=Yamagishiella unicocca TaxID=51707 RepID=A0A2Z5X876_9CHLO|nr:PWWP domain-containing protein [Yamagishiella unicocca]